MAIDGLTRSIKAICVAIAVFGLAAVFVIAGFAFPSTLGQQINPHSALGAKGMTVVTGIVLAAFLTLVVSIPPACAALARDPARRSPKYLWIVGAGSVIALLIAAELVATYVLK